MKICLNKLKQGDLFWDYRFDSGINQYKFIRDITDREFRIPHIEAKNVLNGDKVHFFVNTYVFTEEEEARNEYKDQLETLLEEAIKERSKLEHEISEYEKRLSELQR